MRTSRPSRCSLTAAEAASPHSNQGAAEPQLSLKNSAETDLLTPKTCPPRADPHISAPKLALCRQNSQPRSAVHQLCAEQRGRQAEIFDAGEIGGRKKKSWKLPQPATSSRTNPSKAKQSHVVVNPEEAATASATGDSFLRQVQLKAQERRDIQDVLGLRARGVLQRRVPASGLA